jgi:methionyl aminopeptidase
MISIKNEKEINVMREGGKILAEIMEKVKKRVYPGTATIELNHLAEDLVFKFGKPSFKGYNGFPSTMCISINEEIVHGIPSKRILKEGDIVSLDLGIFYKGFHTDMAVTVPVGKVNEDASRLIRVTKKALKRGLKKSYQGSYFGDIGNTIERYIDSQGMKIIKNLCGHGIGKELHEEPEILNYGKRRSGPEIKKGMVFCIEPMISMTSEEIEITENRYTYKTKDNSWSAHFEHTIVVTDNGPEIITSL